MKPQASAEEMLARASDVTPGKKTREKTKLVGENQWSTDLTLCHLHATLEHLPWVQTQPAASYNLRRALKPWHPVITSGEPPTVSGLSFQSVSLWHSSCSASGRFRSAVMNTRGETASQAGTAHAWKLTAGLERERRPSMNLPTSPPKPRACFSHTGWLLLGGFHKLASQIVSYCSFEPHMTKSRPNRVTA